MHNTLQRKNNMDLYNSKVRKPGEWVSRRWWQQMEINLAGARERVAEEAGGEEETGVEEKAQ